MDRSPLDVHPASPVADVEPELGIVVRPDVLWISVAAHIDDETPLRAVAALGGAAAALSTGMMAIHGGAHLVPGRFDFGAASTEKAARAAVADVRLNGLVTIPLEAKADFWARAQLAARAVETLGDVARALGKSKPPVKLHWRNPTARVVDTEPYRTVLATRWNTHVRALTAELGLVPGGAWDAPDEIAVIPISYDEARLVLVAQSRIPARRT